MADDSVSATAVIFAVLTDTVKQLFASPRPV